MSHLNLPAGAHAGFRLEIANAFGDRFTANIYGAGPCGWFVATHKGCGDTRTVGPVELAAGQWREFLGLIKQVGFWDLPETIPSDPNMVTEDGEWLTLAGREGDRYHEMRRDCADSPALARMRQFLTRLSGFFPEPPAGANGG